MMRLVLLGLLALAGSADAATFYLKAGSNGLNCVGAGPTSCAGVTHCSSWAAFLAAPHTPAAGDIINFCAGTYRETVTLSQSGASGNPITLRKEPGETQSAIISGLDLCNSWASDGSGVFHCAFSPADALGAAAGISQLFIDSVPQPEFQLNGCPAQVANISTAKSCLNYPAKTCTVDADCTAVAGGTCVARAWCWNGSNVYVHQADGTSPAGHTVEVGSRRHNLVLNNRSDVTIDALKFTGSQLAEELCGPCAFDPAADVENVAGAITFTNNIFDYASGAIMFATPNNGASLSFTGNTVSNDGQGVTFYDSNIDATTGFITMRIQNASNGATTYTITGNTFTNNMTHNWARIAAPNGRCDVLARGDSTCYSGAMQIQAAGGHIHFDDNVATNIEQGFDLKACQGTIQAGSTIARNRLSAPLTPSGAALTSFAGIHAACEWNGSICSGGTSDCTISNPNTPIWHQLQIAQNRLLGWNVGLNLSANNLQGGDSYTVGVFNNFVKAGSRRFGNAVNAGVFVNNNSAGIKVYNNSLQCNTLTGASSDAGSGLDLEAGAAVDLQNNILDFNGCTAKITDNSTSDTWNTTNNVCDAASAGHCVTGANTLVYVDETNADFHITSDPSAVVTDKGATLSSFFTTDFDGGSRPQGAAWDIGADEIGSGTTTTSSSIPTTSSTSSSSSSSTSSTSTSSTSTSSVTTTTGTTTSSSTSSSTSTTSSTSTSTTNPGAMCFHCKDSSCRIGQ